MYRLEEDTQEAYFLLEDSWVHECYYDFIISFKEELNYGYEKA